MNKIILSKEQAAELVRANKYKIEENAKLLSRCVDGRYLTSEDLPPLAIPGADPGQLSLLFASANNYGFEVNNEKALEALIEILGGVNNFNLHSDKHGDLKVPASGCGHIRQQFSDPKAYFLNDEQLEFLRKVLIKVRKKGAKEIILEGEHQEGAVIQVSGNYGVYPQAHLDIDGKNLAVQAFVFHSSLVNQRNKIFAEKLIEKDAVKLFPGCDQDYLYTVLSEMTENHVFETLKRLASGLPIYQITFAEDGLFNIKEMGVVG